MRYFGLTLNAYYLHGDINRVTTQSGHLDEDREVVSLEIILGCS